MHQDYNTELGIMKDMKYNITAKHLFKGMPVQFATMIEYIRQLDPGMYPNHDYLINLLHQVV